MIAVTANILPLGTGVNPKLLGGGSCHKDASSFSEAARRRLVDFRADRGAIQEFESIIPAKGQIAYRIQNCDLSACFLDCADTFTVASHDGLRVAQAC